MSPPLSVCHYEVTLSFVNSSQMFGRHESNAGFSSLFPLNIIWGMNAVVSHQ